MNDKIPTTLEDFENWLRMTVRGMGMAQRWHAFRDDPRYARLPLALVNVMDFRYPR